MLKYFISIILTLNIWSNILAQRISGNYHNYFGSEIRFNSDSSFLYSWKFDISSSWTKGTWTFCKDTIYLTATSIYDTLYYKDAWGKYQTKQILSENEFSEKIIDTTNLLTNYSDSYVQNLQPIPNKLLWKRHKLYEILNGKVKKVIRLSIWSKKKWPRYFVKTKQ